MKACCGRERGSKQKRLLVIADLLGGKTVDYPQAADVTFKKAQRMRHDPSAKQKDLPMEGESPEK